MSIGKRCAIGVDLGTTFSAAASFQSGNVAPITLASAGWSIPSVIHLSDSGKVVVGESAVMLGSTAPERTFHEFKREFGSDIPYQTPDGPRTPQWMTTQLLAHIIGTATEVVSPEVLVVTHPANWGPHRLDDLRGCIAEVDAGVDIELLAEPIAAATQYAARGRLQAGETVAIYDFGGGTFDASVVHNNGGTVEIVGTTGGCDIGGVDLDQAVLDFIDDMTDGLVSSADVSDPSVIADLYALRNDCAGYKMALSSDLRCPMRIRIGNDSPREIQIQRREFEQRIADEVDETIAVLLDTIERSGTQVGELTRVLMVGGSSRIPLVGRAVSEATKLPISVDIDTASAIAQGAATHGAGGALGFRQASGRVRTPAVEPPTGFLTPGETLGSATKRTQAHLSVRWKDREAHDVGDRAIVVGRGAACDLVVGSDLVSRIHGRFEHRADGWFYVDDSRNGSFVNGHQIDAIAIVDATHIELGRSGPTITAEPTTSAQHLFSVTVADQLMYPTEGRTYVIGRRPPADIVIDDPQQFVSGRHLELTHDGDGWTIRDISTNGTFFGDGRKMDSSAHRITGDIEVALGVRSGPVVQFRVDETVE